MENITLFLVLALAIGLVLGYFIRQTLAKKRAGSIEERLEKLAEKSKVEAKEILLEAKNKAVDILEDAKKQENERQGRLTKIEELLMKREEGLDRRVKEVEERSSALTQEQNNVEKIKEEVTLVKASQIKELEKLSSLSSKDAKEELFRQMKATNEEDVLKNLRSLELEGQARLDKKAQEIIAAALQRYSSSVVSEVTTTYVNLPNEELKGKIIGKEGRNIKTLERLTGVDVVVDETPDSVMISSFNPIRRQIARVALEDLIKEGRIQPAKIEEAVANARDKINDKVREAGEAAVYDVGITGVDPRLMQLLGRLRYRTSFGQNVLLHSIEAAHIAGMIAAEMKADVQVAKKGALFHDIGKAIDHEVQGTHVEIGRRILEKFNVERVVIDALEAHHGDQPHESLESVIVQVSEAMSAARPGARKDTVEAYLKRLGDIERIVNTFDGVDKSYAIQAGREVRIIVHPDQVDDVKMQTMAKDVAKKLETEMSYPGEIKVSVIRETKATEYAR